MMLWPVEFKLSPSCFECLSWSGDGEVAIAGGDHVQILVSIYLLSTFLLLPPCL